jgi:MFS family permease
MFMVGRIIIGFGSGICSVASPALISEMTYPTHRHIMTSCYNTLWYLGAIVAAWSPMERTG